MGQKLHLWVGKLGVVASLEVPTLAGAWKPREPGAGAIHHCDSGGSSFTVACENGVMQEKCQSQSDVGSKVCAELGKMGPDHK